MSLRDQLLQAGLVDKKKLAKAKRDKKRQRKQRQARREKKKVVEARQEAEQQARVEAERQARLEAQSARQAQREAAERVRQVDNILRHYALRLRPGQQRFWHRSPCGRWALRLDLPPSVAHDLRAGRLAIAWHGLATDPEIVVVPAEQGQRVAGIAPGRILFYNTEAPPDDDPTEQLFSPH